ncbi:MAG: hypothetical protein LBB18_03275 [Puniceicoccales bacterium]|jgi:hypothetical protein|nr:hypothetical protein [Puniceicoccales bacterium]
MQQPYGIIANATAESVASMLPPLSDASFAVGRSGHTETAENKKICFAFVGDVFLWYKKFEREDDWTIIPVLEQALANGNSAAPSGMKSAEGHCRSQCDIGPMN